MESVLVIGLYEEPTGILGLSTYISLHPTIENVSGVVSGTSDNGHSGQTTQPLPIY